ncbi:MAG: ArsI/CadI family heavy metal resistance metalloenzyme [Pseudomonadota bacterium]
MKRFHVNVVVKDLERSISFYSHLFATEPSLKKEDYAKWMLEDPKLNFSITKHGLKEGIDHVGLEVDDEDELAEIRERLVKADSPIFDQPDVECCYANSKKAWIEDPSGIAWETFFSKGQTTTYGDGSVTSADQRVKITGDTSELSQTDKETNNTCC